MAPAILRSVSGQLAERRVDGLVDRINRGLIPDVVQPTTDSDFYFVPADSPEAAVPRIVELVKNRIPKRFGFHPVRDIQVLCPMNRGGVGARSLNIELQTALNPVAPKAERFGWTFAQGDKVMQIENDYDKEVYNGDIGYIDAVNLEAGELIVRFDGRLVTYGFGELDTLVPAYAATIHKSQGSEYPAILIPVMTQHYAMLQRNSLYTGVTRGKKLVVLGAERLRSEALVQIEGVAGLRNRRSSWHRPPPNDTPRLCAF
jgi:exodeoxyribonuclease V alpha subunit